MIKLNHILIVCLFFLTLSSFQCTKNNLSPDAKVTATAFAPTVPLLAGLSANPALRIAVYIPDPHPDMEIRKLLATLNSTLAVEKVDVYLTGAEPFSTHNLVGTVKPNTNTFEIPVNATLTPGLRFLWFSIVLKEGAALNEKIELHSTKLLDSRGNAIVVKEEPSSFTKYSGVAVVKAGDNNIHTYRIPGIVQTDNGTLIAVYDNRYTSSADLPGNIDVGMSRSIDSGRTWQPMKVIIDMGAPHDNNGVGDPAILFDAVTKKIWVAALWSKGNRSIAGSKPGLSPDTTGQFVMVSSADDGLTWTAPYTITPQIKNPAWHLFFNGPGSGIVMQDGKLVFAAQYWDEAKMPYSTIIYSDDKGSSWKGKINGPKSNTTESQVVETTPGTLMLNMRDNRGKFRSVATTANMGATWTEHATSYNALPDPVCMGSLIKAKVNVKGQLREVLFFSNPATSSGRYNMTIKASLDLGETWLPANQVLIDDRTGFGYSSLTIIDPNTIGILYEGARDLYFVKVPVADIIK